MTWWSGLWHVDPLGYPAGTKVAKGQKLAVVHNLGDNTHHHWDIAIGPEEYFEWLYRGALPDPQAQGYYGSDPYWPGPFVDPDLWLRDHPWWTSPVKPWHHSFGYNFGDTWTFGSAGDRYRLHNGIDNDAYAGQDVVAPWDGEIYGASYQAQWGSVILLKHTDIGPHPLPKPPAPPAVPWWYKEERNMQPLIIRAADATEEKPFVYSGPIYDPGNKRVNNHNFVAPGGADIRLWALDPFTGVPWPMVSATLEGNKPNEHGPKALAVTGEDLHVPPGRSYSLQLVIANGEYVTLVDHTE